MNATAAQVQVRYLLDSTPYFVRAIVAPIYTNFQISDDAAMLRSIKRTMGAKELPYFYEAAQHAHDVLAAA